MQNNSTIARIIAIVAVILIAGGALTYALIGKKPTSASSNTVAVNTTAGATTNTQAPTTQATSAVVAPTVLPTAPVSTSLYKDGMYSATGSYISPGADEKIGVTVTLTNDIITNVSVTPEPVSGNARRYQAIFAANYQPLVIGKDISTVHLTTVSGSSLTSIGFNDALAQIEQEAKA